MALVVFVLSALHEATGEDPDAALTNRAVRQPDLFRLLLSAAANLCSYMQN